MLEDKGATTSSKNDTQQNDLKCFSGFRNPATLPPMSWRQKEDSFEEGLIVPT